MASYNILYTIAVRDRMRDIAHLCVGIALLMRPRHCPTSTTSTLGVHLSAHLPIQLITLLHTSGLKKIAAVGASNVGTSSSRRCSSTIVTRPQASKNKEKNKVFAPRGVRIAAEFPDVSPLKTALGDARLLKRTSRARCTPNCAKWVPRCCWCTRARLRISCGLRSLGLDVTTEKVVVGGDENSPVSFTMRSNAARFLAYILSRSRPPRRRCRTRPCVSTPTARYVPSWQLSLNLSRLLVTPRNRSTICEERTGKKLDVTAHLTCCARSSWRTCRTLRRVPGSQLGDGWADRHTQR
ncbi:hypothetical protein EDB87DRAFT_1644165 [Lactarius vividus]|nr:hypothetical protein EDB87DRAFT_1644165 [Lactarius vividus]